MGMYINESTTEDNVCIDENYSGIMGCMQVVSDCIHNEQVMFESLFVMDFKEALNESEEAEDFGILYKIARFICDNIELLISKICSIIDTFTSKLDPKKSKELKELSSKLPTNLDNWKKGHLKLKFIDSWDNYSWLENRHIDKSAVLKVLDLSQYRHEISKNPSDYGIEKLTGKIRDELFSSLILDKYKGPINYTNNDDKEYSTTEEWDMDKLLKNLRDPCYIIDNTFKDLREIKKLGNQSLDKQKKEIKRDYIDSKKIVSDEDLKKVKAMLETVKIVHREFPVCIARYMKNATSTYKAYLYCLKYITKEETVNDSSLEESINYEVDYEFGIL